MSPESPGPKALAEAERWFARLKTSNCLADERAAFERWRAEPEHAAAYAQTEWLWHGIGGLSGNPELEALSAYALRATDPRRQQRSGWHLPLVLAAPVVMGVVALVFAFGVFERAPPPVVYVSGPGQRDTVVLADGSRLVLNADTAVVVSIGDARRALTLERGEAVFEVASDPQRPFRVEAGNGTVTALGTRFQVHREQAQVTVTLLEGRVTLERSGVGGQRRLAPGDQATYGDIATPIALRTVDPDVVSSWTRGRLLFRATPLAEVIAEVNRYATPPLQLGDPALGTLPVSGTFPMGDSESVAFALQALLPVRIERSDSDRISLQHE